MDILYYSNYCKHSQKVLQFLAKGGLTNEISCISIDKRSRDINTNQIKIVLENGSTVPMPPNVHSVPALLLVNKNYQIVLGDDIIKHYEPKMREKLASANFSNGEPMGISIHSLSGSGGSNIISEQYTDYNMSPHELSAKGLGGRRQLHNYVSVSNTNHSIQTPPDTYRPDKVASSVTIDMLQQKRNADVDMGTQPPLQYSI
jgi:hypothetical protein